METRRKYHRLCAFHKIVYKTSPSYLYDGLPPQVHERSSYNLRNADSYTPISSRLGIFYRSFFPQTARDWNLLSPNVREIEDHEKLKQTLEKEFPKTNKLFSHGRRKINIIHSRIRMGCSSLNAHLYNYHVTENSSCACGDPNEDSFHFFFACPRFIIHRDALQKSIGGITKCSIRTVLYGSELCKWSKFGPMTTAVVTTSSLVETFGSQFLRNFEQGQTSELHWWSQPVTSLKSLGLPFHGEITVTLLGSI